MVQPTAQGAERVCCFDAGERHRQGAPEAVQRQSINAGVWSPYSLYREDIATFAAGGDYKQSDATGFISIYGLPAKVQALVEAENK